MAKKDELKIMIDLYKAILLSFLTALFGVLGYTFINFENFTKYKIIIISSVAILLFICVIAFFGFCS
ncbi:hypothetical protein CUPS3778_02275 [Campylobacter upsaliensis]|uniref:hypothetical protein n=1 Tax=Campylobacter upsaliensis TaxID=28080 RepID=UPI00214A4C18|nr:hypothetical protein [Campylobacter upsaliensis]MCR2123855.1 hypothetical protein [Campylobacter upsaliensis]